MTALWPVVCATGHRPQHLAPSGRRWVREQLAAVAVRLRHEHGTRVGISGMALGVDLWWAQAILDAGLKLWAYVPFPQQPNRWHPADAAQWRRILDRAAVVRYFGEHYNVALLHARNDGMLQDSTATVAVWRPSKLDGGTASAVRKAQRLGRPLLHVDPDARTVGPLETQETALGEQETLPL